MCDGERVWTLTDGEEGEFAVLNDEITAHVVVHQDCGHSARAVAALRAAGFVVSTCVCPTMHELGTERARAWLHEQLPATVARTHRTFPAVFLRDACLRDACLRSAPHAADWHFVGGADATATLLARAHATRSGRVFSGR